MCHAIGGHIEPLRAKKDAMWHRRVHRQGGVKDWTLVRELIEQSLQAGCPLHIGGDVARRDARVRVAAPGYAAIGVGRDSRVIYLVERKIMVHVRRIEEVIERKTAVTGFAIRRRPVTDRTVE